MTNKRRNTRELNILSAYLDNALSPRDKKKFEVRLAKEPELQQKLENLRRTKHVLSWLPRLHAPRNFTLTLDMVAERKPRRQPLQAGLRLASALAAVLLVVLFGVEFILGEIRQPEMLAAEAPALEVMEAARAPMEETPVPLIQWEPSGQGGGAAGGIGGEGDDIIIIEEPVEEPVMELEAAPEEESPEIEALPQEESLGAGETSEQPAAKGDDLILGINPDEGGEIIDRSEPADLPMEPATQPWSGILRWAQIALAVIAVGGGIALLLLRRNRG